MPDYNQNTQSLTSTPDRNVVLSSYTHMNIEVMDEKEILSKTSELESWVSMAASELHKGIIPSITTRDGSVIVEIIFSGNLHDLLNIEYLKSIGVIISESDIIKGYLTYKALQMVLLMLIKDVKLSTAALSRMTRWIFKAKIADLKRSESRTGILGDLQRFLDAVNVARNQTLSIEKRCNSARRAYTNLKRMEEVSNIKEDRVLLCHYTTRETENLLRTYSKKGAPLKEVEMYADYNSYVDGITACKEKLCS